MASDDAYRIGQTVGKRWPKPEEAGRRGTIVQTMWADAPVCYVEWADGEIEKTFCRYLDITGNHEGRPLPALPEPQEPLAPEAPPTFQLGTGEVKPDEEGRY